MFGPKVHLFAAAIAFTFGGASAASAGLLDNNNSCCAPVAWGCQSTCATMPNVIYGTAPTYYSQPAYPVDQGPDYDNEPTYGPEASPEAYPYVSPYGYGYPFFYSPRYHRFGPRVHYGIHSFRHFGVTGHRSFYRRFTSGPRFRTSMYPNRFVGHRPMMRGPAFHRAPMMRRHR